jgi:hypothetical protein
LALAIGQTRGPSRVRTNSLPKSRYLGNRVREKLRRRTMVVLPPWPRMRELELLCVQYLSWTQGSREEIPAPCSRYSTASHRTDNVSSDPTTCGHTLHTGALAERPWGKRIDRGRRLPTSTSLLICLWLRPECFSRSRKATPAYDECPQFRLHDRMNRRIECLTLRFCWQALSRES